MIRRSSLHEIVWWIPCLCFFGPAYKAGQDQLGSRDRPGTNSHWLLRQDAVEAEDAEEAGDASVASASFTWGQRSIPGELSLAPGRCCWRDVRFLRLGRIFLGILVE